MVIREAIKKDAELLARIHAECFTHYFNQETFTDFFSVPGTFALLAEEGEALGMIVYRIAHEEADIITVAVRPAFRRRGIAQELVALALKDCTAKGAEKLFLDVEEGNVAAIQLYEKYGFTYLRRRKQYYRQKNGSFTDALVMAKKLG